jgi:hypothetical protein
LLPNDQKVDPKRETGETCRVRSLRHNPDAVPPHALADARGEPELYYRGTRGRDPERSIRRSLSFTPSLPVALIWSAPPGDVWGRRPPAFTPSSTVHAAYLGIAKPLVLDDQESYMHLGDVLRLLRFEEAGGISEEQARRIYNYLHNRILGKAEGGEFGYRVLDEDGGDLDEADVPLSFLMPATLISEARDDWDVEPTLETAGRVIADTYIFADAPAVQKAAVQLGYDGLIYRDVFLGGDSASRELLGEDVEDLDGIEMQYDLKDDDEVPTHLTARPLGDAVVSYLWAAPSESLVAA